MLHKLDLLQYSDFIDLAEVHDCGAVYPLSVAEGIQEGDIFINAARGYEQVLFWAHSGFAYLSGEADVCFLDEVYGLMTDCIKSNTRRFLLMTRNPHIEEYFTQKDDCIVEKRYLFTYAGDTKVPMPLLPTGCALREIDSRLLKSISGQIIPSRFWKNADDFFVRGKGYCIVCGNDIASWAFSAAVSTKEIDIGIETNANYQQRGLGIIVAKKMIQYVTRQAKRPVWACHYKNVASAKMAEKLGFIKIAECSVIKRKV